MPSVGAGRPNILFLITDQERHRGWIPAALQAIGKSLLKPAKLLAAPASARGDADEARVLRAFIANGRIQKIPEAHGKRHVVLQWVVDQLEDRRYREREISERLKAIFDDYATLRRELINHQLMKRENGVYWKARAG